MSLRLVLAMLVSVLLLTPLPLAAQTIGVFRWQLEPYCNVLTLRVEQEGTLYRLDGTDDLCGATRVAPATGLAVPNADGTIGLGLTIVDAPSGLPIHVSAAITIEPLGGIWRDALGNGGVLTFTPGSPRAGPPRPPATRTRTNTPFEWQQAPGGTPRGIVARASENGDPVNGDAAIYGQWGHPAISHTPGNAGVRGESADASGVLGISDNGAGVYGYSEGRFGVFGFSWNGAGIRATSFSGIGLLVQAGAGAGSTALQIEGPIKVSGTAPAFRHVTTPATIDGNGTILEHPQLDGDPNTLVYVTPHVNGVLMNAPIAVAYVAPRWRIVTQNGSAMPAGAEFNVLVIKR